MKALVLVVAMLAASVAQAARTSPTDYLGSSPSFGGLLTAGAGVWASGTCTSMVMGAVCCYDSGGVTCGYPATDIAPGNTAVSGYNATPLGSSNKTGGFLNLAGGWPTISATAVDANCTNGVDIYTLTVMNRDNTITTKTCTASTSTTSSTQFSCAGSTNQALAVEVATCLATATGVGACGGTACTAAANGFVGTSGVVYVYPSSTEPAALDAELVITSDVGTATIGTQGRVLVSGELLFASGNAGVSGGVIPAASNTYLSQCFNNTICAGTPATSATAGGFAGSALSMLNSGNTEMSVSGSGGIAMASDHVVTFSNSATSSATADVGISRSQAGMIAIGTGAQGSMAGKLALAGLTDATATNQYGTSGSVTKRVSWYSWSNAQVTALGASLTGDIKIATLPARAIVTDALIVVNTACGGTASLTASLGRVSASYIDWIVASNVQAAANTVYGDATAERGTGLASGAIDVPSQTGTTDVYVHFISTGSNLSAATTCVGYVFIEFYAP